MQICKFQDLELAQKDAIALQLRSRAYALGSEQGSVWYIIYGAHPIMLHA